MKKPSEDDHVIYTMKFYLPPILIFVWFTSFSQGSFAEDPELALFVTEDIPRFWRAFDDRSRGVEAFKEYLDEGTRGIRGFMKYRIQSADHLYQMVSEREKAYAAVRAQTYLINGQWDRVKDSFIKLKEWYPDAVFPPTYFVIGAFNSGGTTSRHGLIIGAEMQQDVSFIPHIVAHEVVHFNQQYGGKDSLLKRCIKEGSADFIGELISGNHINERAFAYGELHEDRLKEEFIDKMHEKTNDGWLYGSGNATDDRPNDLGYWMGYKICESYFKKAKDKKKAIDDILNIKDFDSFLAESGYLSQMK